MAAKVTGNAGISKALVHPTRLAILANMLGRQFCLATHRNSLIAVSLTYLNTWQCCEIKD